MSTQGLRRSPRHVVPKPPVDHGPETSSAQHPAGQIKYGPFVQLARYFMFATWLLCCTLTISVTQFLGCPLYFINRDYYYAYMALTKRSFGLVVITLTQWFGPTIIRISGDASVRGQLSRTPDGCLQCDFPERLVMITNHQLYTEWIYLWWIAYTNQMHGHIYIILKESIKYIPVLGPGMMFFGFIFMARDWIRDKPRIHHRLQKLKARHAGPLSGTQALDPMWLMIFPEGTNLSANTRKGSKKWAEKQGISDLTHLLLPRSTGLQYCLQELQGTVDWVYDCTVAYEGIPRGEYGQDIFTLRSILLQGRPPKSVNMHWRRFPMSSIPMSSPSEFESWIYQRWLEKEDLIESYVQNGRFPADDGVEMNEDGVGERRGAGFIETTVRLDHWTSLISIFAVLGITALLAIALAQVWNRVSSWVFDR